MLFALVYSVLRLLLDLIDLRLRVQDPEVELLLLRHQLRVVRRQVKRPRLNMADRTMMAALSQLVNRAGQLQTPFRYGLNSHTLTAHTSPPTSPILDSHTSLSGLRGRRFLET
jgi:hypothetical protein